MKTTIVVIILIAGALAARAQIPVTDVANLLNNKIAHIENIAKWADSIAKLRTQIDQLKQQIKIQNDIRQWAGDPSSAGARLNLDLLGAPDLLREFGQTRSTIVSTVQSLSSLDNTAQGVFRSIRGTDLEGQSYEHDALTFRRYAVLDGQQENFQQVFDDSKERERELKEELAATLAAVKSASTDAEVRKFSAKIEAINGQLATLAAERRDQADQVLAQAAAELEARDNHLANKRVSTYFATLRLRQNQQ
jgi:hypothetical protein